MSRHRKNKNPEPTVDIGTIWGPAKPSDPLLAKLDDVTTGQTVEALKRLPSDEEKERRVADCMHGLEPIQVLPETRGKKLDSRTEQDPRVAVVPDALAKLACRAAGIEDDELPKSPPHSGACPALIAHPQTLYDKVRHSLIEVHSGQRK